MSGPVTSILRRSTNRLWSSQPGISAKGRIRSLVVSAVITTALSTVPVALCDDNRRNNKDNNKDDFFTKMKHAVENFDFNEQLDKVATDLSGKIQTAVETGVPTQFSYGFVCGFSSGYALRKVGKWGATVFGIGFITLQSLSYAGYIEIDHDRLKKEIEEMMDFNADGKVDREDMNHVYNKVLEVVGYNIPAGSGFGVGFIGGLRSG